MRGFGKMIWMQLLLNLREPVATFFTVVYAPLMLLLFGAIYGNKPNPFFGGWGAMDISVPAYIGFIIVTVGLIGVPISTAAWRESGVLRRFRATPLHPAAYILSDIIGYFLFALLGMLLLVATGKVVFHIRFEGHILSVLAGITLSMLAFFALGYLIAGVAPTARVAQTVGMVLAFPMMFLSGATVPLEVMPASVREFSRFIPLTHAVRFIKGLWFGHPWSQYGTEIAVLVGVLVLGVVIAARTFRWE